MKCNFKKNNRLTKKKVSVAFILFKVKKCHLPADKAKIAEFTNILLVQKNEVRVRVRVNP